jgi:hypothetical protein
VCRFARCILHIICAHQLPSSACFTERGRSATIWEMINRVGVTERSNHGAQPHDEYIIE